MAFPYPRWIRWRRSTRRRVARALKLVLCALLVVGLLPGSDEIVETIAHLVHDGHLPHSETHAEVAATEDCDDSDEHGCTALAHHCECCPSVAAIPPSGPTSTPLLVALCDEKYRSPAERGPPSDGVKPLLRPPIA